MTTTASPYGDERKLRLEHVMSDETAGTLQALLADFDLTVLGVTFWNCFRPWQVPVRRISDNFLFFVTSGEELCSVDGVERVLRRGECMIVPEFSAHSFGLAPGCDAASHFIIHALYGSVTGVNPFAGFVSPFLKVDFPEAFFAELTSITAMRNFNRDTAARRAQYLVKCFFCRQAEAGHYRFSGRRATDGRVAAAIRFINANFPGGIGVPDIAAAAGLGEVRLRQLFRRDTGMTPAAYLLRTRLVNAARLLARYDLPLAQVAAETGFSSESYLCTAFRRCFERTPEEYRRFIRRP